MKYSDPNPPEQLTVQESTEEKLRKEVEDLKRQLREQHGSPHTAIAKPWHPSAITIWALFLGVIVLIVVAFLGGYIPLQKRNAVIASQAQEEEHAVPRVEVLEVGLVATVAFVWI